MRLATGVALLVVVAVATVAQPPVPAVAGAGWVPIFRDDFDGPTLDLNSWAVEQMSGALFISNGLLQFRSQPTGLPTIVSNAGIVPTVGDFRVRMGFQYGRTSCFGTRIGMEARGIGWPVCGNSPPDAAAYGFHRDCARGTSGFAYPVTTSDSGPCGVDRMPVRIEGDATSYHVGELTVTSESITLTVDGLDVQSVPQPLPRPNVVYFGWGTPCCQYTEFDVDFVEVQVRDQPVSNLRTPQVPLNGAELQNYLNGVGESIDVYTQQLAAQVCSTAVSENSSFSLMIELAGYADQNTIGVYDAFQPTPTLYEVFPGQAGPGWVGLVYFLASGDLVVNLFDDTGTLRMHTVHPGVNTSKVGFYIRGPGGTYYSEDGRNGGNPQAVMYEGTGRNWGDLWLCWEDLPYAGGSDRDFNDAILMLQSLQPVPTVPLTWGAVKARYR